MLVLSRKLGEEVIVPEQGIILKVVNISGDKVRLGITAPSAVRLYRQEVWDRIVAATPLESLTPVP